MNIVAFYAYKGGTGRTLLAGSVAQILYAQLNQTVVVVDFDIDAPGLTERFRLNLPNSAPGAVSLLAHEPDLQVESLAARVREAAHPLDPAPSGSTQLWVIPAGQPASGEYWTQHADLVRQIESDAQMFERRLDHLVQAIELAFKPDWLVFDLRTGMNTLAVGVSFYPRLTHLVLIATLQKESLLGLQAWSGWVKNQSPIPRPQLVVHWVLSRVPGNDAEGALQREAEVCRYNLARTLDVDESSIFTIEHDHHLLVPLDARRDLLSSPRAYTRHALDFTWRLVPDHLILQALRNLIGQALRNPGAPPESGNESSSARASLTTRILSQL